MSDLDASVTFHGSPDLVIDLDDDYELVSVVTSERTWRRTTVEGPYMHGRALVNAVLDVETLTVQVRCKGATWTQAQNNYQALLPYVSAFSYQVTVSIDGYTTTYTCEPADVSAPLDKFAAMARRHLVTLTIPTSPITT